VRLINYATALYFAMDMLLRCIADGVLFTPGAYLLVSVTCDPRTVAFAVVDMFRGSRAPRMSCSVSHALQKVHHLLDVALLIIDGLVLLKYQRYVVLRL
jgi:hypothetical protein